MHHCWLALLIVCMNHAWVGVAQVEHLKGTMVDWSLHLFHDEGNMDLTMQILGDKSVGGQARIIREGLRDIKKSYDLNHDGTGLSVILPWSCEVKVCENAKAACSITDDDVDEDHIRKIVVRRDQDHITWVSGCKLFAKVELTTDDGGLPGARSLGGTLERGRLASSDAAAPAAEEVHPDIMTPTVENIVDEETVNVTDASGLVKTVKVSHVPSIPCTEAELNKNPSLYFNECCIKVEPKVALSNGLCRLQAFMNRMISTTTPSTVASPEDVVISGRDFDNVRNNGSMDVMFKELNSDVSSWKHSYYTVLGFFIVFLLIFLIVVGFLVFKIKGSKTVSPPVSPGVNLSVPGHTGQQRRRGYSSVGDGDEDRAPLTPATQQAQTFNY